MIHSLPEYATLNDNPCPTCPDQWCLRICTILSNLRTRSPKSVRGYPLHVDDHILHHLGADEGFAEEFGFAGDGETVAYFSAKNTLFFRYGIEYFQGQDSRAILAIDNVGK